MKAIVDKAYKIIASAYAKTVKSENFDNEFIERFLRNFNREKKILDVGCGSGNVTNDLVSKHRLNVVAIDISPAMIKLAKKRFPKLDVRKMDLRDLKFSSGCFDGIFANYSLIHISEDDVLDALKGFYHVLKKNGLLYLSLQEPTSVKQKDGLYPVAYNKKVKMFINLFSEKEIVTYLKKAGFKILWTDRRKANKKFEFPFNKLFLVAKKK
ncbi:hypothetical protein COV18_02805 [Candidatus Woesearchaeota archaeon CG10_big_fil_rev_8_21_14_0_10_37_12]|nr:MAG: hypothetical protein COV18_02805 [Candidatus Woesearchaeota archaeon CG10_big_fil_rev_8_21_14_0_10_37_12]